MNSQNSMYKHIKNKFIQSISRLISSPEITPITTRTVSFNTVMAVLIMSQRGPQDGLSKLYTRNI